jgi:hypothetical protein
VFPKLTPAIRHIWITKRVEHWIQNDLATLKAMPRDPGETPMRPLAQTKFLFERFIQGQPLYVEDDFWLMRPEEEDVFELKTLDVRFFGWFPEPKKFLIAAADSMEKSHTYNLHDGYRNEVVNIRERIDLFPKLVVGAKPEDVF